MRFRGFIVFMFRDCDDVSVVMFQESFFEKVETMDHMIFLTCRVKTFYVETCFSYVEFKFCSKVIKIGDYVL